ncbi:MAG: DUF262 domain-containing protein [Bacteroidales bacterium]|jgi:hypothetical protein|nr:DUF262 domain-containing protein [Bacteroidales bacterium]
MKTNDKLLSEILQSIDDGKIQLPDFQRGWVWEDDRIRALIASISNGYPIGAAMFLETGSKDINFKYRLFEGVDESHKSVFPDSLVLDGQQRNTSLYRSLYCKKVVDTVDYKKKPIKRFYYMDIKKSLETLTDRIDAVVSVPENKQVYVNIGRDLVLDLSTPEKEYENHYFPLNIVFDAPATTLWQLAYMQHHHMTPDVVQLWSDFYSKIVVPIMKYEVPIMELEKDIPKEAVCQVFENVNQGGVSLTVFELVTATFAADNFELRKDWKEIWNELKNEKLLLFKNYQSFGATDFLTAITLLVNYKQTAGENHKGTSCKKKDVLRLSLTDYKENKELLLKGLRKAIQFLREERIFSTIDLPYTSQLIPLSVLFAIDENLWFDIANKKKLRQWYWCGVMGELYGGANETRYVNDVVGMIDWLNDDNIIPDTVARSNFHASRLLTLYTRNSAAYKGVMALILQGHAKDLLSGKEMDFVVFEDDPIDIHHIFPASYCEKQKYPRTKWNSVINKTPICARTNRIIGGNAPSQYINSLERNHGVTTNILNKCLASHQINVDAIRADDFETYFNARRNALLDLVEAATCKPVSGRNENVTIEEDAMDDEPSVFD